jgi:hypothetical protein
MVPAIYILGALVVGLCAVMLFRAYAKSKQRLLFWSGLCFLGLTMSNLLVFVDLVMIPDVNLYPLRLWTAAIATMLLVFGLVWESE